MAIVNIINLESTGRLRDLKKILTRAARYLRLTGTINIVVLESDSCEKLNKKYRGKSYSPDVLSFAYHENDVLGEVVVNSSYIFGKDRRGRLKFDEKQFLRLAVHGLVHLAGYDHEANGCDATSFFIVERKTHRYLSKIK